ncbi:hypothetical protein Scep_013333 [Stephania cephalantha]|uniref:Uncharacterized protein n=1 Tax=Stephania cephalantha TaxID=152367 RepID=A0AAP0JHN5_9MAGN
MASKGKTIVGHGSTDDRGGAAVKNGRARDLKIFADARKSRVSGSGCVGVEKAKTAAMPTMTTARKSLSAAKGINPKVSSDLKAKVENSENLKGKRVSTVNAKERKALADISNARSNLSRGRASGESKPMYDGSEKSGLVLGKINCGKNLPRPRASAETMTSSQVSSREPVLDFMNSSGRHSGNSVKIKIRKKVVTDLSNTRGSFQKNRASDSFIALVPIHPGHQAAGNVDASSRRSLRPIGKNAITVFSGQMNSKSKRVSSLKVSISAAATSLKKKNNIQTNSISKNVAFIVSNECNLEKTPSEERSNTSIGTQDANLGTKRVRRRSFTSSFMARLEEKLPNIDDDRNPLEVSAYIDDIYQYYWVMEAQYPSLVNYMETQTNITPDMRGILINWLIEVHFKYELMPETLFLMVALFDRFISIVKIAKSEIQLVGLTALLLASKYEDFWHPRIRELISVSAGSYTSAHMLAMEKLILEKLMFRLNIPTPYVFMLRFLKAAQSDRKLENLSFYLIELCLVKYEALTFKASLLAASAIYVARCTLHMTPAWTPLLCKHAHYEESQLRACANMILKFQKVASTGPLMVTYEKYAHPEHCCVAEITPIDKLPHVKMWVVLVDLDLVYLQFFVKNLVCIHVLGLFRRSRVYPVTAYGADPTGQSDSTNAILRAISDAFQAPSNRVLIEGIVDLGGAEIHLEGGTYLISQPLGMPSSGAGNLMIHGGSLKASNDFPTDRYLIEISTESSSASGYGFEDITLKDLLLDSNYRGGGILVVNSVRTKIDNCYISHFTSDGILAKGGHETFIRSSFLGQHITAGGDKLERNFTGTGINLMGNDNALTDVVIFSAAVGVMLSGQANLLTNVHCYNKATYWGGVGIYVRLPGLSQTRIVNSYLDYTGVYIVDNLFNGGDTGTAIVQLDQSKTPFTKIEEVIIDRNNAKGMALKSTVARGVAQGNASSWTLDFTKALLFPNLIKHVQYTLSTDDGTIPNHALRNVSDNRVVVQSSVAVPATVYVTVDQGVSTV